MTWLFDVLTSRHAHVCGTSGMSKKKNGIPKNEWMFNQKYTLKIGKSRLWSPRSLILSQPIWGLHPSGIQPCTGGPPKGTMTWTWLREIPIFGRILLADTYKYYIYICVYIYILEFMLVVSSIVLHLGSFDIIPLLGAPPHSPRLGRLGTMRQWVYLSWLTSLGEIR